jgi:hypothetical protein
MGTRLQVHVERRAPSRVTGPAQGQHLGVGSAGPAMVSLADDSAVADDHAANDGVRVGLAEPPRRELERPAHPANVVVCHGPH